MTYFRSNNRAQADSFVRSRERHAVPLVTPGGGTILLTPGTHNELQAAIVHDFGPRFAPNAELLYLGDARKKNIIVESERMTELGLPLPGHGKLPDILLWLPEREWLFLIEAVTSHGPIDLKRWAELNSLFASHREKLVFVTAFPDMRTFRTHLTVKGGEPGIA